MTRLVALIVLVVSVPAQAQAPVWFASWRLDLARSVFTPGVARYAGGVRRIEANGQGVRIVEEFVHSRGGVTHLEWTGAFDGREYRVHGVDLYVTYSYRQVGERTVEGVVKVDGVVTSTSRETLSPDGRTLTIEAVGHNSQQGLKTTMVFVRVTPRAARFRSGRSDPVDGST